MPSILSNPMPQQNDNNDPLEAAKSLVQKIMQSANPQATFQQMLESNPELKKMYDEMNRYGNGNPQQAFVNYAAQTGKNTFANQIMENFINKLLGKV